MAKITILIAVYNAEKYLCECLDSLLGQTLKDIQVVCVDDASSDHSWDILQRYSATDSRVEVIHLAENGGQGHARNVGLERAKGEYICFLDSDDWFAKDSLTKIVEKFESDDRIGCVLFRCLYVYGQNKEDMREYKMEHFDVMTGQEAFAQSLTWKIHGVYAVKSEIHKRFPYDESSRAYSDDNTTHLHYLMSPLVADSDAKYFYRQHGSSVTHQVTLRRFDCLKANESMKKTLLALQIDDQYISEYENLRWLNVVGLYLFAKKYAKKFSTQEVSQAMQTIREVWETIEPRCLLPKNHYKFGYIPFRSRLIPPSLGWWLFRSEQALYYLMRRILGNLPD